MQRVDDHRLRPAVPPWRLAAPLALLALLFHRARRTGALSSARVARGGERALCGAGSAQARAPTSGASTGWRERGK